MNFVRNPLVSPEHPTFKRASTFLGNVAPYGKLPVHSVFETANRMLFEKLADAMAKEMREGMSRCEAVKVDDAIQALGDTRMSVCVQPSAHSDGSQWEYITSSLDLLYALLGSDADSLKIDLRYNKETLFEKQWNTVRLQYDRNGRWYPVGIKVVTESDFKVIRPYWHYHLMAKYLLTPLTSNIVEWHLKQGRKVRVSLQQRFLQPNESYGHGYVNPRLLRVINVKTNEPVVIDMFSVVRTVPMV